MKNPDVKNLRVAVVPTETGNNIDQSSTVEEILACSETELYPLTDYFQAQNDEQLGLHWSFLIDMETKIEWTGSNLDGIHQHDREAHIDYIKKVLNEWGETSTFALELESSPCMSSAGNGRNNVSELVEQFFPDHVSAITYQHDVEIGWNDYNYEDLSDDIIDEIYVIMQNYEADQLRTEKRCSN